MALQLRYAWYALVGMLKKHVPGILKELANWALLIIRYTRRESTLFVPKSRFGRIRVPDTKELGAQVICLIIGALLLSLVRVIGGVVDPGTTRKP